MTCEWERCRRRATHEATWPDGKRLYCYDHGRGVAFSHKPLPDLDAKQMAGVMAAILRYKEKSQRLVDKSDGLTRTSVRFGDGPEITVAEKRKP